MPIDYRGDCAYIPSTNRPPLYIDGALTQATLGVGTLNIVTLVPGGTWAAGTGGSNSTLLSASSSKVINVVDPANTTNPWIASRVVVNNNSGQTATLLITTARNKVTSPGQVQNTSTGAGALTGGQLGPTFKEVAPFPITILSTETMTLDFRITSITEVNGSGGSQTGQGLRYTFTPEPLVSG